MNPEDYEEIGNLDLEVPPEPKVDNSEELRIKILKGLWWLQIPTEIIANIVFFLIILCRRSMVTTANILWLTVALASILQQLLVVVEITTDLKFVGTACQFYHYLWLSSEYSISFIWVAVAFHSFLSLINHHQEATMKKFSPLVVLVIWLLASFIAAPIIPYSGEEITDVCYTESHGLFHFLTKSILKKPYTLNFPKGFQSHFYNISFYIPLAYLIPIFFLMFISAGIIIRLCARSADETELTTVPTKTDLKHGLMYFVIWLLSAMCLFFSFDNERIFAYVIPVLILTTVGCTLYRGYIWQTRDGVNKIVLVLAIVCTVYWLPYFIIFIIYLSNYDKISQFFIVCMSLPYLVLVYPFLILCIKYTCLPFKVIEESEKNDTKKSLIVILLHVVFFFPYYATYTAIFGLALKVPSDVLRWVYPLLSWFRDWVSVARVLAYYFLYVEVKTWINDMVMKVPIVLFVHRYRRRQNAFSMSVSMSPLHEDKDLP